METILGLDTGDGKSAPPAFSGRFSRDSNG
jgi:hypothetical protein